MSVYACICVCCVSICVCVVCDYAYMHVCVMCMCVVCVCVVCVRACCVCPVYVSVYVCVVCVLTCVLTPHWDEDPALQGPAGLALPPLRQPLWPLSVPQTPSVWPGLPGRGGKGTPRVRLEGGVRPPVEEEWVWRVDGSVLDTEFEVPVTPAPANVPQELGGVREPPSKRRVCGTGPWAGSCGGHRWTMGEWLCPQAARTRRPTWTPHGRRRVAGAGAAADPEHTWDSNPGGLQSGGGSCARS